MAHEGETARNWGSPQYYTQSGQLHRIKIRYVLSYVVTKTRESSSDFSRDEHATAESKAMVPSTSLVVLDCLWALAPSSTIDFRSHASTFVELHLECPLCTQANDDCLTQSFLLAPTCGLTTIHRSGNDISPTLVL